MLGDMSVDDPDAAELCETDVKLAQSFTKLVIESAAQHAWSSVFYDTLFPQCLQVVFASCDRAVIQGHLLVSAWSTPHPSPCCSGIGLDSSGSGGCGSGGGGCRGNDGGGLCIAKQQGSWTSTRVGQTGLPKLKRWRQTAP